MTGFSIPTCKDELRRAIPILREHGLKKSACFCAEQLVGLAGGGMDCASPSSAAASAGVATLRALEAEPVTDAFMLASSFFELGEYARCAVALCGVETGGGPLPAAACAAAPAPDAAARDVFLWAYALYLAGEKRREEEICEASRDALARAKARNSYAPALRDALAARKGPGRARGPRRLRLRHRAQGARARAPAAAAAARAARAMDADGGGGGDEAAAAGRSRAASPARPWPPPRTRRRPRRAPCSPRRRSSSPGTGPRGSIWRSSTLRRPRAAAIARQRARRRRAPPPHPDDELLDVHGPRPGASEALIAACHRAHVAIEQQRCDEALETLARVEAVAPASTFVVAHEALAHYARRDFDRAQASAQERFEALRAADPYRLEQLDIYSNVLYVKEARAELSRLAHAATRAEKYRPETCCVVGNYYSLKAQHERAVLYFQRALKLDRGCLSAWTLMGHEYIEMKNTAAAIEAYRRAVDVNARDYRAWYGLGQTYEILNMYFYALYYYRKAARLRPYDARMWIAIAQCHEKLHRVDDAIKGYERAAAHDDAEGHATIKLARLHRSRNDHDKAVACFQAYVDLHGQGEEIVDATAEALLYLASKHKQKADYAAAQACLARLLDYGGPEKLEAQAMLRELRSLIDTTAAPPA
ncbi:procollagen-lysine 5-dioxygenase [Aureococcus anophagefferens]|uniref:Procollagen-lysine 5-dioxygenase n=1 Tax=Aureococcus anophagefferens TaxID=44056 RepID=A0ABR1FT48_AURAN